MKNYTLKPTYKPVPSGRGAGLSLPSRSVSKKGGEGSGAKLPDPALRAENEDDDGYDPYSDRREERPLFEQDPWD